MKFERKYSNTKPRVNIVQIGWGSANEKNKLTESIRKILRFGLVRRFIVSSENRLLVEELFDKAEDATIFPYRLDEMENFDNYSISNLEKVVVFHFSKIDETFVAVNKYGSMVSHWLIGGAIENSPGKWPFLYEFDCRPYPGVNSLNEWMIDLQDLYLN
jgi:hypothetical protein